MAAETVVVHNESIAMRKARDENLSIEKKKRREREKEIC